MDYWYVRFVNKCSRFWNSLYANPLNSSFSFPSSDSFFLRCIAWSEPSRSLLSLRTSLYIIALTWSITCWDSSLVTVSKSTGKTEVGNVLKQWFRRSSIETLWPSGPDDVVQQELSCNWKLFYKLTSLYCTIIWQRSTVPDISAKDITKAF